MAVERAKNASGAQAAPADKRQRSSIEFPYGDLDDAVEFAKAIRDVGGQSCEIDQVAAHLKQAPSGGAFRMRLSYPRVFGLTENERGIVRLTELGKRIVDPQQEAGARAEAFLGVPLYRAIYDKYKGYTLPPPAALEREIANLGVSSKQTDKARQAFDRSAKQAGFFWAGPDRLVMPVLKQADAPDSKPLDKGTPGADESGTDRERKRNRGGSGGDEPPRHPLVEGLFQSLPPDGETWTLDEAADWLQAAAYNLRMAYKFKGVITVTAKEN